MHLRAYNENKNIGAVIHTHSPYATCFAAAEKPLNGKFLTETIMSIGDIPCAPYALPGSEEVPNSIADYCKKYNGVLLAHHGVLTWGRDLIQAYMRMESIEFFAKMSFFEKVFPDGFPKLDNKQVKELEAIRNNNFSS